MYLQPTCSFPFIPRVHILVYFVLIIYMLVQNLCNLVRFEVSTAVTIMIIFWEMTPCGSYKNRRFGGSYRLHLQGARVRAGYRAKL
jgi:uncharacterized protein YqgC (DUF456 family)